MPERPEGSAALTIDKRSDGIAVIVWDETSAQNGLLEAARLERGLEASLDEVARWPPFAGLVLVSMGSDENVAGPVLSEIRELRSAEQGAALARRTQVVAARIASLAVPCVAALRGACRGRALALALAADARIASHDEHTFIATPEVRLGIVPTGGTTLRLPRLVGVAAALDLLLGGRRISAAAALRLGLVDRLVPEAGLVEDAVAFAKGLCREPPLRRMPRGSVGARIRHLALGRNPIGRALFFRRETKRAHLRTRGNYPAPMRLLEVVRGGLAAGLGGGSVREAEAFGDLAARAEANSLLRVFAAQEELANESQADDGVSESAVLRSVGILGAGPTGAGIAWLSAMHAGVEVRLAGRDAAARERGIARVRGMLDRMVLRERLSRAAREAVLHRVRPVTGEERLEEVDLVVDAEPGSIEDKRRTIARLRGFEAGRTIYASSLVPFSIASLASASARPGNVLGMRYATPVARSPLLEVVAGEQSSPHAVAACTAFGRRQGKSVIVVRDSPAFYCARILVPWFNEALWQLSEGLSLESIDWALVAFGFPAGPFARLDDTGIDVGASAGRVVHDVFGERMRPPPAIARLIADGRLGRRSGRGFYNYEIRGRERRGAVDGSVYTTLRSWPVATRPAAEIALRCVLAMMNEAAHCLGEGVVRSARDGDVGAVFGAGFPAFLGGPFRYVDSLGAAYVVERLEDLAARCGTRFRPAPLLTEMAKRAGRFYSEED